MALKWSKEEEQIIIDEIEKAIESNKMIKDAFEAASERLTLRNLKQCTVHYYSIMIDKYPEIAKKVKNYTAFSSSKWNNLEDTILVSAVLGSVANGDTFTNGFKLASSQLENRNWKSCEQRWYDIKTKYRDKLLEAKKKGKINKKSKHNTAQEVAVTITSEISKTTQHETKQFNTTEAVNVLQQIIGVLSNSSTQNEVEVLKARIAELEKFIEDNIKDSSNTMSQIVANYNELLESHTKLQQQYNTIIELFNNGQKIIAN